MAAARVIHGAMGRMIHRAMVHHVVMHVGWTGRCRRLFRLLRQITPNQALNMAWKRSSGFVKLRWAMSSILLLNESDRICYIYYTTII